MNSTGYSIVRSRFKPDSLNNSPDITPSLSAVVYIITFSEFELKTLHVTSLTTATDLCYECRLLV
jgi:hypothetical protein